MRLNLHLQQTVLVNSRKYADDVVGTHPSDPDLNLMIPM